MIVITPPTAEPLSLAEVKEQIGIGTDTTDRDAVILRRISQARAWAEDYLARTLMPTVYELALDSFQCEVELDRPPVIEIVSVRYYDAAGVLQTVDPGDYELDLHALLPILRPVSGSAWPAARGYRNDVRIRYRAGFGVEEVGAAKTITAISRAAPGVVGITGHGWSDGQLLQLDVGGMTELDGGLYRTHAKAPDSFQFARLDGRTGVNTLGFGEFTSGSATPVQTSIPPILLDAMALLVGHWTNYQSRLEGEGFITRVPLAIQQMFDSHRIYTF